jgi:hypothetical protein
MAALSSRIISDFVIAVTVAMRRGGHRTKDIDTNFDSAADAALHLAAKKDAASLPGYTGKIFCD